MIEVKKEFKDMEERVLRVLESSMLSRNSDKWLIFEVLQLLKFKTIGKTVLINFNDLEDVPSFETITRCRRKIQNKDNKFLPTDPQVLVKRRFKEEQVRAYYGDLSMELEQFRDERYKIK